MILVVNEYDIETDKTIKVYYTHIGNLDEAYGVYLSTEGIKSGRLEDNNGNILYYFE